MIRLRPSSFAVVSLGVVLLGLPAVALPMDVTDGLPGGVQIYAERWREDLCLEAASVIEAAVGTRAPIDPVI